MCPLPMFHVFAAYPILMSCLMSGAQIVMPTPQGYRGDGVMDNFWKLIERHRVTFLITVPTAAAALMQRKVDADVSTLRLAISGSAAMPVELFHRFEAATGVTILEGYGMTEATCLVSINPPYGERKIGSVGLPFPYTDVRILHCDPAGAVLQGVRHRRGRRDLREEPGRRGRHLHRRRRRTAGRDRRGLPAHRRSRADRRGRLYLDHRAGEGPDHPRRAQHRPGADRGGADAATPTVAFAGAIGQPDAHAGEVPAAYVELVAGGDRHRRGAGGPRARATSPSRRRCRSTWRCWPSCRRPRSARCSSPTCGGRAIARVYDAALARPARRRASRRWSRTASAAWSRCWRRSRERPRRRGASARCCGGFLTPLAVGRRRRRGG